MTYTSIKGISSRYASLQPLIQAMEISCNLPQCNWKLRVFLAESIYLLCSSSKKHQLQYIQSIKGCSFYFFVYFQKSLKIIARSQGRPGQTPGIMGDLPGRCLGNFVGITPGIDNNIIGILCHINLGGGGWSNPNGNLR